MTICWSTNPLPMSHIITQIRGDFQDSPHTANSGGIVWHDLNSLKYGKNIV